MAFERWPVRWRSINFTLTTIGDALVSRVTPQVSSRVAAPNGVLTGTMSREQLQIALALSDRKSFRELYLLPALDAGWIEMTVPAKPTSRIQRYRLSASGRAIRDMIERGEIAP